MVERVKKEDFMQEEDKIRFAKLMTDMSLASRVRMDKATMRIYWDKLKDYKLEFVERGIDRAIKENTYHVLPMIGQIIKNMKG